MIIVHLSCYEGCWLFWGEMPSEEEKPAGRGRRPAAKARVKDFPFDVPAEMLREALAAAGVKRDMVGEAGGQAVNVWLPTAAGRPVPSSLLVAVSPEKGENVELNPWKVTAVSVPSPAAVAFLAAVMGRQVVAPGIIVGSDTSYWAQVLRWAGSLVARERFLPGITKRNGAYYACWEPIFTGDDLIRLKALCQAMPAACRALTTGREMPVITPLSLLTAGVGEMVDTVVRIGAGHTVPPDTGILHERWIHALQAPVGMMEGKEAELNQFALQVKEWQRKVYYLSNAPLRFCFRLEEPEEPCEEEKRGKKSESKKKEKQEWSVRYLLQAIDDPSLIVPVGEAWPKRGRKVQPFGGREVSVPELVLTTLGQVAAICPEIEKSLRTPVPEGYFLDNAGAYEFLNEKAPLLEQNGFIVQVPSWWTKKGTRTGLTARARVKPAKMKASAGLSLDVVVDFDWEIALGEEVLTQKELENLAKMKSGLVKVRGQWVEINADRIKELLRDRQKGGGLLTAGDAVRMALGAVRPPGGLPFGGFQAEGWVGEILDRLEGRTPWQEMPTPAGFRGTLRPYQQRGYSWLEFLSQWGFGACLADDMGLGKTIQTLALVQRRREKGETRPVLLICPTSLVGNWRKEAARFTPDLSLLIHHGPGRTREKEAFQKEAGGSAVVVSSYSLLHRDFELFRTISWAGIILDEAQNVKNANTRQAQAAQALKAGYKVALTGTPVENNVGELWSLMQFLNPGLLGTQSEFNREFFIPIQVNRDDAKAAKLKKITGPFILRRMKTDKSVITDLPDKIETKAFCTLTREQASLYAAVIKDVEEKLQDTEGIERKGLILATLSKLKQICNHPGQFLKDGSAVAGRSGKIQRLAEMCEEILEVGERALVFTQFAEMGEILRRCLMESFGRQVLFLHGGTAPKERDRMVELFQGEQGPPFFVLSLKAGGTGLNLTRANHVFHFDRWWNPAVEDQATDRAFRIGQTKHVQVHKFVTAGTVEEKIDEMIEQKKEMAARIVGSGEGWLTELSTAQLKEIWALRQEAMGN